MKILVTGADGQLGLSMRKIAGKYPEHSFAFTDLPEGDITDPEKMGDLIDAFGAEAIVNCAAYTAVDKAESEPELAAKVNTYGPAVLAELSESRGVKLVHISTDYVFSGEGDKPYCEEDHTSPLGVYGCTKLAGEREITKRKIDSVIIRTAWLYSEFGHNFVKTMLRLSQERSEVSVVSDQVGTPTYATGLAHAIMTLVDRGVTGHQIYHYSDRGEISWYDFAVEIFRQAGVPVKVIPIRTSDYPAAVRRPAYSTLDKKKIECAGVEVADWKVSLQACLEAIDRCK